MSEARCDGCLFFRQHIVTKQQEEQGAVPHQGTCRRYPATLTVEPYHWCGEHRPAPAAKAPQK
ncbi:MAG TPA: hypothetical protein VF930_05855 [Stellaceae bacterium]